MLCCCCDNEVETGYRVGNDDYCDTCHEEETTNCVGCSSRIAILDNDTRSDSCCGLWCRWCYDDKFTACDDCGCELEQQASDTHSVQHRTLCDECREDHQFSCDYCRESFAREDIQTSPDGDYICRDCFNNRCSSCDECEETFWNGDLVYNSYSNRTNCENCGNNRRLWNDSGFFTETPTYDLVGSERKYGIELETHSCDSHEGLRDNTVFGAKEDGSVDGLEFVSPVLYGDEGFKEIDKICGFARAHNWVVTSSCGYHLHCDMSNETDDVLFKVALAYHLTYDFWTTFISDSRKNNYYCALHDWDATDIFVYDDFKSFVCDLGGEKYRWMHVGAYSRHKTFEIRHHGGTMNATKIKNWVKANLRFVDAIAKMTIEEITFALSGADIHTQFGVISEMWDGEDSTELADYYRNRAEHFNHPIREKSLVMASV